MKKLLLLFFFLGGFFQARAQYSKQEIIQFLSNGSQRDWLAGKYKAKKNSCHGNGTLFTFHVDGSVELSSCVKGKPKIRKLKYEIDDRYGNDLIVRFTESFQLENGKWDSDLQILLDMPALNTPGKKVTLYIIPNQKTSEEGSISLVSMN